MAKLSVSVDVPLPPEQAWQHASDLSRYKEWLTIHRVWRSKLPETLDKGTVVESIVEVKGMPNRVMDDRQLQPAGGDDAQRRGRGRGQGQADRQGPPAEARTPTIGGDHGCPLGGPALFGPIGMIVAARAARRHQGVAGPLRDGLRAVLLSPDDPMWGRVGVRPGAVPAAPVRAAVPPRSPAPPQEPPLQPGDQILDRSALPFGGADHPANPPGLGLFTAALIPPELSRNWPGRRRVAHTAPAAFPGGVVPEGDSGVGGLVARSGLLGGVTGEL